MSLLTAGYIVWTIIYVVGIGGAGPVASNHEQQVALYVSIAWNVFYLFFVLPMMAMIFRGGWFRVTAKVGDQPQVSAYDQDA